MTTSEVSNLAPLPSPPGGGSSGNPNSDSGRWLGSQSVFEPRDQRKLGRAMFWSICVHGAIVLAVVLWGIHHVVVQQQEFQKIDVVFLNQPGPGGGGGGSPQPAPPKKLSLPHPTVAPPVPVPVPIVPPPTLTAPVETNLADVLQAQGNNNISISQYGGGGRGTGIGPGSGSGLGPGSGGGTGGGVYDVGNGVESPVAIRQVEPSYTSEAMRAKVQGKVLLDAIVEPTGALTNITVAKSLDRTYGLDQAAIDAARRWLFIPGKKDGKPVAVRVQLEISFVLH